MPPADRQQLILNGLALLAACFAIVSIARGTGRTVIPHRGRILPVAAAAALGSLAFAVMLHPQSDAIGIVADLTFVAALGALIHVSARWDSLIALPTQAAAAWATSAAWVLAHDVFHAVHVGGGPFLQPWNPLYSTLQVAAPVIVAVLQAAAIRGARSRARRPASVAVAQGDGLRTLRGVEAS